MPDPAMEWSETSQRWRWSAGRVSGWADTKREALEAIDRAGRLVRPRYRGPRMSLDEYQRRRDEPTPEDADQAGDPTD